MAESNDIIVTIIIPVYNTGAYLKRCVDSVLSQTYQGLEVILVDDGSTDNSGEICDAYQLRDSRVVVVHKSNKGLGEARNTGLERATGKYICFVDSDDYIDRRLIEDCLSVANRWDLDVISYGFVRELSSGKKTEMPPVCKKNNYFGKEVQNEFLPELMVTKYGLYVSNLQMSLCASFIKLEIIRCSGWKSASERELISEDVYSLLELYSYVKSVGVINKAYYHYVENPKSLTNSFRSDRFLQNKKWYDACIKLCERLHYNEIIKVLLSDQFFSNAIGTMKTIVASEMSIKRKVKEVRLIGEDKCMRKVLCDKEKYSDTMSRKVLAGAIRWRMYTLCTIMLYMKAR